MALALDGSVVGWNLSHGTSATSGTFTTTGTSDIICVGIGYESYGFSSSAAVSSVTATGLTFVKRSRQQQGDGGNDYSTVEFWYATTTSAFSGTITVNFSSEIDDASMAVWAFSGVDTSAPFDTSANLPISAGQNSSPNNDQMPQTAPLTTLNADCALMVIMGGESTGQGAFGGSWTQLIDQQNGGGTKFSGMRAYYQIVSSAQSLFPVQSTSTSVNGWCIIADAIVAASPSPGTAGMCMDGYTTNAVGNSATLSDLYLTTQGTMDLIIVAVCSENGTNVSPRTVSSITDSASLTFSQLAAYTYKAAATGQTNWSIEIWAAQSAAALSNDQITVTMSGAPDILTVQAWGVNGGNGVYPVLDSNSSAVVKAANGDTTASHPAWSGFSTTSPTGIQFTIIGSGQNGYTVPSGWTQANLGPSSMSGGTFADWTQLDAMSFTSAQSNTSGTYTGATDSNWGLITFAIVQGPVSGTWTSTEAKDTFSGRGFVLVSGTWASTEAKDVFAGAGFGPPISGTWASAEAPDVFDAVGTEIPPLGIDAYATGGGGDSGSGITQQTVTLSTNYSDEVIVVYVVSGGHFHAGGVTSVTDTAGLTWHRRNRRQENGVEPFIEIWWAHAPTPLSADVITVNTASTGAIALIAFGVKGANYSAPWDTHVLAGWYTDNIGSGNPPAIFSTNAARSLILAMWGSDGTNNDGTISSPFTYATGCNFTEHVGDTMYASLAYHVFDTQQNFNTVSYGETGGNFNNRSIMSDAIVAFGETGTAQAVPFYFDMGGSFNGSLQLTGVTGGVGTFSKTVSTYNENLMIVSAVLIESASGLGECTGITDTNNALSPGFARRSRVTNRTGTMALEIWYAYASAALSSDTLNYTFSNVSNGDTVANLVFGIGNTSYSFNSGEPFWDGDASLPALAHGDAGGDPSVAGMSTLNQTTLSIVFTANETTQTALSAVAPFVDRGSGINQGFNNASNFDNSSVIAFIGMAFNLNYAPMVDANAQFHTSPDPESWVIAGDAIPVGIPVPPTGVWAGVEAPDRFTHPGDFSSIGIASPGGWVGFPPNSGTLAVAEVKDTCTNNGAYTALGWFTGWAGWIPADAGFAATDTNDTAALYGWVIGQPITGRWCSTEAPDRMAASNEGPAVTGTWRSTELPDRLASSGFEIPLVPPPATRSRKKLLIVN